MIIAGILDVILWIIIVLLVIGVIVGIAAFLGLRKLWRFIADAFESDGREGPGNPPLSRRGSSLPPPTTDR